MLQFLVCRSPSPYLSFYIGKVAINYLLLHIPLSNVLHHLARRSPCLYPNSLGRIVIIIYILFNLFLFNVLQNSACRSPYSYLNFYIKTISIIFMLFYYFIYLYPILSEVLQNLKFRSLHSYLSFFGRNVATIYMLQNLLICFRPIIIGFGHVLYFCNSLFFYFYPVFNTKRHPEKTFLVIPHIILCKISVYHFVLSCIHILFDNSIYYFDSFRTWSASRKSCFNRTYYITYNGMLSLHSFHNYHLFYVRCLL